VLSGREDELTSLEVFVLVLDAEPRPWKAAPRIAWTPAEMPLKRIELMHLLSALLLPRSRHP
jgi:hypothetical protein